MGVCDEDWCEHLKLNKELEIKYNLKTNSLNRKVEDVLENVCKIEFIELTPEYLKLEG